MSTFRADIQGVRALAVLSVIAYHFRVGLSGGFLGVDIFFVVSGFVVGSLLLNELHSNETVRIGRFLGRRVLRLLPALVVVVVVTVALQSLFFLNVETRGITAYSGLSSLFGFSNFEIADRTGGYFGELAERNPLLHTWSLSVEWQFYLFLLFCVLLFTLPVTRKKRRFLPVFFGALALVSFGISFVPLQVGFFEIGGFYSPFSRAWEFLLGVLTVFVSRHNRLSPGHRALIDGAALMVLVGSLLLVDYSFQTPGVSTLVPVVATAILIANGGADGNRISSLLSARPLVWLGDLSYSLYLWHWPLYVMWVQFGLTPYPEGPYLLLLCAVTLALAWASKRFVEDPFRRLGKERLKEKLRSTTALFGVALLVNASAILHHNFQGGQATWVTESRNGDIGETGFTSELRENHFPCASTDLRTTAPSRGFWLKCLQSKEEVPPTVAVVGDSHAQHLFLGIAETLSQENVVFLVDDALPIYGETSRMDKSLQYVRDSTTIDLVIISAFWSRRGVPVPELQDLLIALTEAGKDVVLTDGTPIAREEIGYCKWPRHVLAGPRASDCESDSGSTPYERVSAQLQEAANPLSLKIVPTYNLFCVRNECSVLSPNLSAVFYRDRNHLNILGSHFVGRYVASEAVS